MNGIKASVTTAILLAFVAGVGAGAWVSDLRAAPTRPTSLSIERRVKAWTDRHELTPSEVRRLRDVLLRYDADRKRILSELSKDEWTRLNQLRTDSRKDIDLILSNGGTAPASGG